MIRLLILFSVWTLITDLASAQVLNDDCANAIDYGILNNRQTCPCMNGAQVDTMFVASNIGAVPNFPFYYTNNFCGFPTPTDTINGAYNDVWYKVKPSAYFQMTCLAMSNPVQPDTLRVTFWTEDGGGCGHFLGGSTVLLPLTNGYSDDFFQAMTSSQDLYLQISGKNPTDTVNLTICLRGYSIQSGLYCSLTGSSYDSLCFTLDVTHLNPTTLISNDGEISLTMIQGNPPYKFNWNTGDTTQLLTSLTAGEYSVTITDSLGCSSSYNFSLSAPTSSENRVNQLQNLYPNPASTHILLDYSAIKQIYIYSSNGTLCKSIKPINSIIDVSELSRGIYTMLVEMEGQPSKIKRFAIQR